MSRETYPEHDLDTRVRLVAKDAYLENRDAQNDFAAIPYEERLAAFLSGKGMAPPMPWIAIVNALTEAGFVITEKEASDELEHTGTGR